jgi:hypothetical protein
MWSTGEAFRWSSEAAGGTSAPPCPCSSAWRNASRHPPGRPASLPSWCARSSRSTSKPSPRSMWRKRGSSPAAPLPGQMMQHALRDVVNMRGRHLAAWTRRFILTWRGLDDQVVGRRGTRKPRIREDGLTIGSTKLCSCMAESEHGNWCLRSSDPRTSSRVRWSYLVRCPGPSQAQLPQFAPKSTTRSVCWFFRHHTFRG